MFGDGALPHCALGCGVVQADRARLPQGEERAVLGPRRGQHGGTVQGACSQHIPELVCLGAWACHQLNIAQLKRGSVCRCCSAVARQVGAWPRVAPSLLLTPRCWRAQVYCWLVDRLGGGWTLGMTNGYSWCHPSTGGGTGSTGSVDSNVLGTASLSGNLDCACLARPCTCDV